MTPEKYKQLSIKEFTQAAKVYDSDMLVFMKCVRMTIRQSCQNWKRNLFMMFWTVDVELVQ